MQVTPVCTDINNQLKKPKQLIVNIKFDDKIEQMFSMYLYNISDYFRMAIDREELLTFEPLFKDIIYALSLNTQFTIEHDMLIHYINFCNYICCNNMINSVYDYVIKTYQNADVIATLFKYISLEQKINMYNKCEKQHFTKITSEDFKNIALHNPTIDRNLLIDILTSNEIKLNENETTIVKSLLQEASTFKQNSIITYRLRQNRDSWFLENEIETLTGVIKCMTELIVNEYILETTGRKFNMTDNALVAYPLVQNISQTNYNNIVKQLYLSSTLHLLPIIHQCMKDQNINLTEDENENDNENFRILGGVVHRQD